MRAPVSRLQLDRPTIADEPDARAPLAISVTVQRPSYRRRGRRSSYFAVIAARDEISLPEHKPLGYITQARLIRKAQAGDIKSLQTLWLTHCRLAYSVANRANVRPDIVPDIIQDAQIAICRSIQHFDIDRLLEFSTYAFTAMRREVFRSISQTAFSAPIRPGFQSAYVHFRRQFDRASSRAEWFDTRERHLANDPDLYNRLLRVHAIASPEPLAAAARVACGRPDPFTRATGAEIVRAIEVGLATLTPREQEVLIHRYGLRGETESTLEEIGLRLGITRERVRQIQRIAERRLRKALQDRGWEKLPGCRITARIGHLV